MSKHHEEEFPRRAGNMIVNARCPTHGYELLCACKKVFQYIPGQTHSAKVNGSDRAMCPDCNMIWNEKLQWFFRLKPVHYGIYLTVDDKPEFLVMVGTGVSVIESISRFTANLNDGVELKSLRYVALTSEEFNILKTEIQSRNKSRGSVLDLLFGDL